MRVDLFDGLGLGGPRSELLRVAAYAVAAAAPPAPFWTGQEAFVAVRGQTPRTALAGMAACCVGAFANAFVLARLKVATGGRGLAFRMIGSSAIGAAADTAVVLAIAFAGIYGAAVLLRMGLRSGR